MVDQEVLAGVEAIDPIALTTQAFRHVAHDRDPLSGARARLHGGRWNPPESFSTLYLALERETTIGEFYRLAARQGRSAEDFLPRSMYSYEIELAAVLDLRDPRARDSLELGDADLKANDAAKCRQIGAAADRLGLEGVLAPSATGAGTILAAFPDRLRDGSRIRAVDPEPWIALRDTR